MNHELHNTARLGSTLKWGISFPHLDLCLRACELLPKLSDCLLQRSISSSFSLRGCKQHMVRRVLTCIHVECPDGTMDANS